MKRGLAAIFLSCLLYGLAVLGPGPERRATDNLLRDLAKPLVLPTLWASLEESIRSGHPDEIVGKGQLLMRYLPEWVDGRLHFAWLLARASPTGEHDLESTLQRLLTALLWLDQSVAILGTKNPNAAAEILLTQAFFVEVRTMQDPRLETGLREEFGRGPAEVAASYVDQAIALAPSQAKLDRRIMLYPRLIAGALRMGDQPRARMLTETALTRLGEVRDQDLATTWSISLRRFRRFLDGDPGSKLEDLSLDRNLTDIIAAYRMGQD